MTIQQIFDQQSYARKAYQALNEQAAQAHQSQIKTVQLAWELGDVLHSVRDSKPTAFAAFVEGAGIPEQTAKQVMRVRALAQSKDEIEQPGVMRQALFSLLVPAKEAGEERVELCPPETWRKWVNGARIWARRVEVGLSDYELDAFVRETEQLYELLADARKRAGKGGQ